MKMYAWVVDLEVDGTFGVVDCQRVVVAADVIGVLEQVLKQDNELPGPVKAIVEVKKAAPYEVMRKKEQVERMTEEQMLEMMTAGSAGETGLKELTAEAIKNEAKRSYGGSGAQ